MVGAINQRGFWEGVDDLPHLFDEHLSRLLCEVLAGKTVLDIGCGDGRYVFALRAAGIAADGVDGNPDTRQVTGGVCTVADISEPVDLEQRDAVVFLEVGEHIPREYEDVVIDNVTNAAKSLIIASWATPKQSGHGHFNCREKTHVCEKFAARGWSYNKPLADRLRQGSSLTWFVQNILVFTKE